MRIRIKEVLEKAEDDFEAAWLETGSLIGGKGAFRLGKRGSRHVLIDTAQRLREIYLDLGFDEAVNPMVVDEADIYKQYGHEAPAILDRCYYLAAIPRPDIGIGAEKVAKIRELGGPTDVESLSRLREIFHDYKKGKVEGDDLVELISKGIRVPDTLALKILNEVFPELRALEPVPSKLLLRSHMTSAWFLTCAAVQHKLETPVMLFSVGLRARREQQEDATHLRFHHAASSIIMDEEVSVDDGKAVSEEVIRRLGFSDVKVEPKQVTAKYYAPGTEHEVFAKVGGMGWVELMDFGLYSPVALARYGIEYPVLNIGIGVERVAMLLHGYNDVRELSYPQFYGEWILSDASLVKQLHFIEEPSSDEAKRVELAIVEAVEKNRDASSPCEFIAYEGMVSGRRVRVYVYEPDPGVRLVGPAAFNEVVAYNANILGVPERGMENVDLVRSARSSGMRTGIRYLDAVAKMAAARIERDGAMDLRVRMVKLLSDINLRLSEVGMRYVSSRQGKIDVRGPAFIGVRSELI
ncbi:MAG: O-phosphoserine--tRNA ligase [Candidatus Verstraetearchaeota archaeon]|nr:O-phosphoserine--tRNA ligase [Candidatus Verstraetearchaeota archaeon]